MTVRTPEELDTLREGGKRLAAILNQIVKAVRPGVTTLALDRLAESLILSSGGKPAFKGYRQNGQERPFPASLCTSVNDEVVHAIPRHDKILRPGDIIGLDIGMQWPAFGRHSDLRRAKPAGRGGDPLSSAGLITDMAVTVAVGDVSEEARGLITATREALEQGIRMLKPGMRLGDLGHAIQRRIEKSGFSVVRDLAGHGVGRHLHEDPQVINYGLAGSGGLVTEGMVLAIEPMATTGGFQVMLDRDGWAWRTKDGSLAAHFEHTVIVTKTGAEILTKL